MSSANEHVKVPTALAHTDHGCTSPAMFMHYTISEDRSGDSADVSRTLLAILGAWSGREVFPEKAAIDSKCQDRKTCVLVDQADAVHSEIDASVFKALCEQAKTQYDEADYQVCIAKCKEAVETGRRIAADFEALAWSVSRRSTPPSGYPQFGRQCS